MRVRRHRNGGDSTSNRVVRLGGMARNVPFKVVVTVLEVDVVLVEDGSPLEGSS